MYFDARPSLLARSGSIPELKSRDDYEPSRFADRLSAVRNAI